MSYFGPTLKGSSKLTQTQVKDLLEHYADRFNNPNFIDSDPISIPHQFSKKQDIEVAGLFTATFSWGQRKTIINKSAELMTLMDQQPHDFVSNHSPRDSKRFEHFVHRTFQYTDTLYFLSFLKQHYQNNNTLEDLFLTDSGSGIDLSAFHDRFFSLTFAPSRTRKHIPTPMRKSSCKRINMFLRWMVRNDGRGVDFGIWKRIQPRQLLMPLDVHVDRVARKLNLLKRKQTDWLATNELTSNLRSFDSEDPVKYDFALFGMGIINKQL